MRAVAPLADPMLDLEASPPRLKSRIPGIIALLVVAAVGYFVYRQYNQQEQHLEENQRKAEEDKRRHDEDERKAIDALPDPGTIKITSTPSEGGVWLKLGRTPFDSLPLSSAMMHEIRVEGVEGYQAVDTQVLAMHWSGEHDKRKATIVVALKPIEKEPSSEHPRHQHSGGKPPTTGKLPAMPPTPPAATGFVAGRGLIHVESSPQGAEVWMFLGMTNQMELSGIQAGQPYELRVLKDGFVPGYVSISADEWRDGGDPNVPINSAKKKLRIDTNVELVPDPNASEPKKAK